MQVCVKLEAENQSKNLDIQVQVENRLESSIRNSIGDLSEGTAGKTTLPQIQNTRKPRKCSQFSGAKTG